MEYNILISRICKEVEILHQSLSFIANVLFDTRKIKVV